MDVNDALDHLNEILTILRNNNLHSREDEECYEVISDFISAHNYENIN